MIHLQSGDQKATVDRGELVSYQVDRHEYIHQKGSPGWRNSDTEMFPVIGPTAEAGFRVQTPKGAAVQDQHGLLRELDYELISQTENAVIFQKTYASGAEVRNSKFPEKSSAEWLKWPYSFEFHKKITLQDDGLQLHFEIGGQADMPYMLGYHPAFKLYSEAPEIKVGERTISLAEVLAAGSRALEVADTHTVVLKDMKDLQITSEGFRHFMLWTEVPNMVCIEPITFYPYSVAQSDLHQGFELLKETKKAYTVQLKAL